jgi:DNA polymerase III delta prime subunit
MNEVANDMVWSEKYRPKNLDDAILPESTKKLIRDSIANNNLPNFLFTGTAGVGKTTLARIIALTLDADLLFINASLDRNIDTIRNTIVQYSSTVSLTSDSCKFVLLDEADGMNTLSQQSLRGVIEEFPNTRFIFTCNFKNKVIDAIHSRCVVVDFKTTNEESPKLQTKFFKRVCQILELENVKYDKAAVATLVKKNYPDFRKTLNELQRYGCSGEIDTGILLNQTEEQYKQLLTLLKDNNFGEIRKWVGNNADIDVTDFFYTLYDMFSNLVVPKCLPPIILEWSDQYYKAQNVADPQLPKMSALIHFMSLAEWK